MSLLSLHNLLVDEVVLGKKILENVRQVSKGNVLTSTTRTCKEAVFTAAVPLGPLPIAPASGGEIEAERALPFRALRMIGIPGVVSGGVPSGGV